MSQMGSFVFLGAGSGVTGLTGNTGGLVSPDGGGNINVIGAGLISIAGNPGTFTLTAALANGTNGQIIIGGGITPIYANITSAGGTITVTNGANTINLEALSSGSTSFLTDAGTALPAAGVITVLGGLNLGTTGVGSTVTVNMDAALASLDSITMNTAGSFRTGTTAANTALIQAFDVDGASYTTFATLTANNIPTMDLSDSVTKAGQFIYRVGGQDVSIADGGTGLSTAPTNGQLLIGNAGNYSVANITSTGSSVVVTNGTGTINLEVGGTTPTTFTADGGTANPSAGNINILGGTNITTSATGSTVTANLDSALLGLTTTTFATGGTIRTGTAAGNSLFLQAFDVDGASYTVFATLTANNTPTMDLSDSVTKAGGNFIYRVGGQDISITDGGTGLSTTPNNGQLLIGNAGNYSVANITSTGTTITITNGTGTINLEAANQNGASSFVTDAGTATPATNAITMTGGNNINTTGVGSVVTANLDTALFNINSINMNNGASIRSQLSAGNSFLLQARDIDGGVWVTFATLTSNNTPTMDLTDAVTKAGNFIYRVGGQDVSVPDGGTGVSTLTPFSVLCGGTTATAAVQSVASVGTSGQILTSNGAGALPTFQAPSSFTWNEITGTSVSTVVNNGYITNNAALVTATLPAVCAVGDSIAIVGKGVGGWRLAQNAGQTVHFGSSDTTTGAGGSLEFTNRYDTVEVLCTTANTEFTVRAVTGNLTVV